MLGIAFVYFFELRKTLGQLIQLVLKFYSHKFKDLTPY